MYATVEEIATGGPAFDAFMEQAAKVVGEAVRSMMEAFVTLRVTAVRPLIDMGPCRDQSVWARPRRRNDCPSSTLRRA